LGLEIIGDRKKEENELTKSLSSKRLIRRKRREKNTCHHLLATDL
jgi:hypothetical protein